jgi:small conductance mechanosensitive channel
MTISFTTRGRLAASLALAFLASPCLSADPSPPVTTKSSDDSDATPPQAPARVEVEPQARDDEIRQRLQRILEATSWFQQPSVRVDEGVVFLGGSTGRQEYKEWATTLAQNTRDVVAVVNRMQVRSPPVWDLGPAWQGLIELWRDIVYSLPFVVFGLFVLLLSWGLALFTRRSIKSLLRTRIPASLLRGVVATASGILTFLLGLYIVLKVSGLTRLALTVVGGTGLVGLVIGIAFRDITENFLASILLSIQRPFRTGDLVEIGGMLGIVQQLNVRTTVLMTLTGNHVQIPNALVYKSTLTNFTSNPNRREDFTVGIGYDADIARAQEIALKVLGDHPAVLREPEPWVLADSFGSATVNLRIYFWLNGSQHSWLKVRSSVIRLVKRAFQQHGIAIPDEAREILFPNGVPVRLIDERANDQTQHAQSRETVPNESDAVSVKAEAGLANEAEQIEKQVRRSRPPEEGENLLDSRGAPEDSISPAER